MYPQSDPRCQTERTRQEKPRRDHHFRGSARFRRRYDGFFDGICTEDLASRLSPEVDDVIL